MKNLITIILQIFLRFFELWVSKAPQREQKEKEKERQDVRKAIVSNDADTVSAKLDSLLSNARDRRNE
jgi:hypothetical protein